MRRILLAGEIPSLELRLEGALAIKVNILLEEDRKHTQVSRQSEWNSISTSILLFSDKMEQLYRSPLVYFFPLIKPCVKNCSLKDENVVYVASHLLGEHRRH